MAIINPEDVEGAPGGYGAGDERIAALEAELARARAYNGKEYIEALNKHISNLDADRTQARAERDAARRALDKLKKKARAVAYPGFKAIPPSELVSTDRRRIEELKAAVDEARAAIKAEGE